MAGKDDNAASRRREAERLSNELSLARLRDTGLTLGGGFEPVVGLSSPRTAHVVDPFNDYGMAAAPPPRTSFGLGSPSATAARKASQSPVAREPVQMRPTPVAYKPPPAVPYVRPSPQTVPYYDGSSRAVPIPIRPDEAPAQLTPQQHAIVDAFWDEHSKWVARNEDGTVTVTPFRRESQFMMSPSEARALNELEMADRQRAIDEANAAHAATPVPRRLI